MAASIAALGLPTLTRVRIGSSRTTQSAANFPSVIARHAESALALHWCSPLGWIGVAAHRHAVRLDADGVARVTGFAVAIDARVRWGAWRADATEPLWRAIVTAAGPATNLPRGTAHLTVAAGLTDTGITAGASARHGKRAVGVAWIRVEVIVRIGPLLTLVPIFLFAATTFATSTVFPGFGMIQTERRGQGAKGKT